MTRIWIQPCQYLERIEHSKKSNENNDVRCIKGDMTRKCLLFYLKEQWKLCGKVFYSISFASLILEIIQFPYGAVLTNLRHTLHNEFFWEFHRVLEQMEHITHSINEDGQDRLYFQVYHTKRSARFIDIELCNVWRKFVNTAPLNFRIISRIKDAKEIL